jgi:NDP-sugar pyrophosphorylase family protein
VIKTQGLNIIGYEEKPIIESQINLGVYAIEPRVLEYLGKPETIDMPSFIMRAQKNSIRTIIFPVFEHWADLGTPIELADANLEFKKVKKDY